MDRKVEWRLSPAFDVAYAHNPDGHWTNRHQMSLGGKRDGFELDDLVEIGRRLEAAEADELHQVVQFEAVALVAQAHLVAVGPVAVGVVRVGPVERGRQSPSAV